LAPAIVGRVLTLAIVSVTARQVPQLHSLRRLREKLGDEPARAPPFATRSGQTLARHAETQIGRNLFGLPEIGAGRLLERDAVEFHDALIALGMCALIDGQRQNAGPEQRGGIVLAG